MTLASPAVRRGRPLGGRFAPPGDKSITHRAVLFGLLAEGASRIEYANPGEDCLGSLRCAESLGATVRREGDAWHLTGAAGALHAPGGPLDCGNSGTTMRMLAGIVGVMDVARFNTASIFAHTQDNLTAIGCAGDAHR